MREVREIVLEIPDRVLTALSEGNDVRLGEIEPGVRVILRRSGAEPARKPKPPEAFVGEALT